MADDAPARKPARRNSDRGHGERRVAAWQSSRQSCCNSGSNKAGKQQGKVNHAGIVFRFARCFWPPRSLRQRPQAGPRRPPTLVVAAQVDDIISMDPAQSFEFSGQNVINNYDQLVDFDRWT